MTDRIERSDRAWRELLSSERYRILRQGGTEIPFTGAYWDCRDRGLYRCAGCGNALFQSDAKYDSGTGWPSFFSTASDQSVDTRPDTRFGMVRTEVTCARCASHLGHLYEDDRAPTGKRYCVNSGALRLVREEAGTAAEP